jgi:predicted phosphodiesterase
MYKIAHISDIHLQEKEEGNHKKKFESLLKDIFLHKCNHLVITGDINNTGELKDYKSVKILLKKFGFFDSDKLTVTIGNHDIFGGAKKGDDVFLFPQTCKNINYNKRVYEFFKQFEKSFEKTELIDNKKIFPFYKLINDRIALIGINSIAHWSMDINPNASNGYIDDYNFIQSKALLNSEVLKEKIKIVLIHHHFGEPLKSITNSAHNLWLYSERRTMKLHNKKRIFKLFKETGVDLILHGHTHISDSYKLEGCLYVNSSGCIMPFTENKLCQYHIINFDFDTKKKRNKLPINKITLKDIEI